jgi:CubicO group peptidase (beta-lactamase class C family)
MRPIGKFESTHPRLAVLILTCAISIAPAQKSAPSGQHVLEMTLHSPESVGFSSERLERLHLVMQQAVDKKEVAGVITLLARHGKIVDYRTYGQRDMEAPAPMTKDTIFRDYSMTKPVTGVAMMILFEEGKWLPNDPIAKYIPEFAHLKVFNGMDANGNMILVEPDHAPRMFELMSHTAGFTYGIFGDTPVDKMVRDAHIFQSQSLQEFIDKLAKIPLLYQPGKGWTYSVSMDIEGYIVEKLSGKTLPEVYRERIFNPLGMTDAGFYVPQEKWARFAKVYYVDQNGALSPNGPETVNHRDFDREPAMPSGGGGMVSTIEDYYRFAQMMANGGELNGKRILSQASIKLMTTNHVPEPLITQGFGIGAQRIRPGFGYGYNCAVEYDPQLANLPDGKGTFLWDGAAGTWFWVDPANDVVFVGMIQRMNAKPSSENLQYESRSLVYQALLDPSK